MIASSTGDVPPIILLVEDHIDTLEVYEAVLRSCGYWVACAASGREALESAGDLRPDAIVVDVGLTGEMDGADLIRAFHADQKLRDVPVLVVTGREPRNLPSFAGLVVSGLLIKPVAPESLVGRIEQMLDEQGRASQGLGGGRPLRDRPVRPSTLRSSGSSSLGPIVARS